MEAVPFIPNILPNVGMGLTKGTAARLEDGWATVGSDLDLAHRVAEEECEGQGLTLNHTRTWG